jgi:hypothetical protein
LRIVPGFYAARERMEDILYNRKKQALKVRGYIITVRRRGKRGYE